MLTGEGISLMPIKTTWDSTQSQLAQLLILVPAPAARCLVQCPEFNINHVHFKTELTHLSENR